MADLAVQYRAWTEQMFHALQERISGIERNGHPTERLPHNLNMYLPGVESRAFIVGLNDLAISTGSACTTASVEPSHVITALGFGEQRAHCSLRFGLGRSNDAEQVAYAVGLVARQVRELADVPSLP
jgi:cysteine desulfurase